MIISLKWLREFVDCTLSVEQLAHRLTMAGLEIDAVRKAESPFQNVVVGRVDKVVRHPKADRLSVCTVFDGSRDVQVVCGAPNVREGILAPLALVGATLPNGMTIQPVQLRGVESFGMLCSRNELGLGEDASGIWILEVEAGPGTELADVVGGGDTLLEIGVTPNRGDCLSMLGVAREVAAICGSALRVPDSSLEETEPDVHTLASVSIEDPEGCPRYTARVVRGVSIGPSPAWLKERVESLGVRSINNIVDVTNLVLLELGQPLHAFDYDRLREHRIEVRRAVAGQRFTTLDGTERLLHEDTLLICDGAGPVAVAGIMGGLDSEITPETRNVLIESAYFDPVCIRRTSKKLGLRSESSFRFERGIDPDGVVRAVNRAARLMREVGGGEILGGVIDVYPRRIEPLVVTLRVDRVNRFLGMKIEADEMARVLRSIQMTVEATSEPGTLAVTVPTFRPDVTREVDLAEEVARLVGYDAIPITHPTVSVSSAPLDPHMAARQEVKNRLKASGFFEVINYSFISLEGIRKLGLPEGDLRLEPIPVRNPLSEELAVMRTTLLPGILNAAAGNMGQRNEDLRIYELSKVFLPKAGEPLPHEPHQLAGLMAGRRDTHTLYGGEISVDYSDVKGAVEFVFEAFNTPEVTFVPEGLPPYIDPLYGAVALCDGAPLGVLGRLHAEVAAAFDFKKPVFIFELDFDRLFALRRPRPLFRSLPKFPPVVRDIAVIADEALAVTVPLEFIRAQRIALLEEIEVFDIYRSPQIGEGRKSLGYRLVYRAADRSLTDEEVNELHGGLTARVIEEFKVALR